MFKLLPLYLCLLCLVVQPILSAYLFSPTGSVISENSCSASENGSGYDAEYDITPERRGGIVRKRNRAEVIFQMMRNGIYGNPGYPKKKKQQQNDSSKVEIVNDNSETKENTVNTNETGSVRSFTDNNLDTVSTTLQDTLWYLAVIIVLCYVIYCIYYLTLLKEIYRDGKKKNTSDYYVDEEEEDDDYSEEDNFEKVQVDLSNFIE